MGEGGEPRQQQLYENRDRFSFNWKAETLRSALKAMNDIIYPLDHLIDEIVSDANMYESFDYVISHLEHPRQRDLFRPRRDSIVELLRYEISTGTFRILRSDVRDVHVTVGYKARDVQAPHIVKRIGIHAIMVVVEKYTYPSLIKNTAASIKGRGMHWLHHIIEDDLVHATDQTLYYYQCDIKRFYESIDQDIMRRVIREYVSDSVLLPVLDSFITLMPHGLSKGLRSSQCFANLYLSSVDKEMLSLVGRYHEDCDTVATYGTGEGGVRYLYYRYCDDVVIFSSSKKDLWRLRDKYVFAISRLGLSLNPSEAVRPLSSGLDFLGYVHYGTHSLLRKRIKQTAARKLSKVRSRKRRQQIIGSFKGMACHGDCKHLFYILTHQRMKKFSEMGVRYTPADGKKRFPGKMIRLSAIVNKVIEVHDYECGINTSQGEDRYVISFRDTTTGEWGKFFTASEEMKNILDQVSDIEDGFPFETTIVSEVFDGNKVKYKFT